MKNPYWIEKHRYYELKHFCLQYPLWKRSYLQLDGYGENSPYIVKAVTGRFHSDPTVAFAEAKLYYAHRLGMVDSAAYDASQELYMYLRKGVTEGLSYEALKTKHGMPCGKDMYYEAYRRFFWLLDRARK